MIICHCARITSAEIDATIDWMRCSDPYTIITRGKIYRALGKKPDCGGCLPLFLDRMSQSDNFEVPAELANLRDKPHARSSQ